MGMGISIASYAGEVRLGLCTDEGLVPDPERIIEEFHEEFESMLELSRAPAVEKLAHGGEPSRISTSTPPIASRISPPVTSRISRPSIIVPG